MNVSDLNDLLKPQDLANFFEKLPTFDSLPHSFQDKNGPIEKYKYWRKLWMIIKQENKMQKKKWDRLQIDIKYKTYDRLVERLLEKHKLVDPESKAEIEKQAIFKAAGYTSTRPLGSPFVRLKLTADQYNRLYNPARNLTNQFTMKLKPKLTLAEITSDQITVSNTSLGRSKTIRVSSDHQSKETKPLIKRMNARQTTQQAKNKLKSEFKKLQEKFPSK